MVRFPFRSHARPRATDLQLQLDASNYSDKDAAALYVEHPEGLPTTDGNSLIVGPLGSGKTIMLKALSAQLGGSSSAFLPIYVDLNRWISTAAGETETYPSDVTSPGSKQVLEALSLSVVYGLWESAQVFSSTNRYDQTLKLFSEAYGHVQQADLRSVLLKSIKDTLFNGESLPRYLPTVFSVASAIGQDLKGMTGRLPVILVDHVPPCQ